MKLENIINNDFRGCIAIKQEGQPLFQKAYGYCDLPNEIPNSINTKFATASAGKVFIAVAILQLIEKGSLQFEDKLGDLIDFDLKSIDPDITVKQLLTHTSGIPDYFDESIMEEYEELWLTFPNYKIRTSEDLIPLFIDKPMMYPKGEQFQYNNTGFVVLGIIIEKISGMLFDQYLKTHVFDIANMQDTGYYELDRLPAKCANNYIYDEEKQEYRTNIYSVDVKGTGAGGAFTTTGDIIRFWDNLLSFNFISEKMTKEMLTIQNNDQENAYGYGIWIGQTKDGTYIPYFEGCDPGVSFVSEFNPNKNTICVLVSNYCDDVWDEIKNIRKHLYL